MDDTGAPVTPEALFGAVLRSFRKGGLRETAAKIPINFSHLAKWERGERPVPKEMITALDRAYAANGALITLHELITRDRLRTTAAALGYLPATEPALLTHGAHRVLGRVLSAIGTVTGTPPQILHALAGLEELSAGIQAAIEQRDGIVVEEWDHRAREYALACAAGCPGALLAPLTLHWVRLGALLGRQIASATAQAGLLRVAARWAALLAGQWADLGEHVLAEWCWQQARAAANSSGDNTLRVHIRARQAHAAYWAGQPPLVVATLIEDTLGITNGAPTAGLALAYATGALIAAERGDSEGVRAALGEFDRITDQLPATTTDNQAWPGWELPAWARAYHRAWPTLLTGDIPAASQAIAEAEKLCPPGFADPMADLRLYRAYVLIAEGDVDHGLELALAAVQAWPLTPARRRVLSRLLEALPAQAHVHPATQSLHRLL